MKKAILFILITMLLVLSACKEKEEAAQEAPVEEAQEAPVEETAPEAPLESLTPGVDMISEARCLDNAIEIVFTNLADTTVILGRSAVIHVNGLIASHPECDKLEVAPGESVYCADISGPLAIRKGKQNKLQISTKTKTSAVVVDCQ